MSIWKAEQGTWSVHSELDFRWCKSGRAVSLSLRPQIIDPQHWTGGPIEMRHWVERCIRKYGQPPSDTTQQFVKDSAAAALAQSNSSYPY